MLEKLFYFDSDPQDKNKKPTIVFLHGFFMSHMMFKHQIEALSNHYRVICPDFRCFGKSNQFDNSFTLDELVNDVVDILKNNGISEYYVIGMSMGGYIAQRLSILNAPKVKGTVLISTQANKDNQEIIQHYKELVKNWRDERTKREAIEYLLTVFFGDNVAISDEWRDIWLSYDAQDISLAMQAMIEREDFCHKLSKIQCPVAIIHGDSDDGIPLDAAYKLEKLINDATLHVIENGKHGICLTHHEEINKIILNFLRSN